MHARLAAAGAIFGSKMGWERPNVFAPAPGADLDYSWGKPSWLPWSAAEQRATREAVAVFDQTSFSKYVVAGPRALEALQWVCAADVDVPVGHCVYTPWLNARGTYEADLTVTRDGPDSFWVVSSSATTVRDLDWLRRHGGVEGGDVTDAFAVLGVMGPASRDLSARISSDDWSEDGFPFATSRTATVAGVPLRATRMTYVGELGWELTVPVRGAGEVYDALFGEGADLGVTQRGLLRDRLAPAGEGLPRLPARAVARLHAGRGGAGLRHRARRRTSRSSAVRRSRRSASGWPRAARDAGSCRSCSRTPTRCSGAASSCSATAARPARSPAPPGARRSAPRSASPTSARTARSPRDSLAAGRFEVDVAGERFGVRLSLKAPLA